MKRYVYILLALLLSIALVSIFISKAKKNTTTENQEIGLRVGNTAPDFKVDTIKNTVFEKEDAKNKIIVITSSAAWCNTCVYEAEQFSTVYEKLKNEDIVFLTIDIDPQNNISQIRDFQTKTNTPWDYSDARGASEIIRTYKLNRFEITYVIDRDGIIQYTDQRITNSDELEALLEQIL